MRLALTVSSGDTLDVHRFSVGEAISGLFSVSILARTDDPSLDLESIVGQPASFRVTTGLRFGAVASRTWTGVVRSIEQVEASSSTERATQLSAYSIEIVPELWLLTQRRNYRLYQHVSIPDITARLLAEHSIAPRMQLDRAKYPKLELRVQYAESDYAFLCRLWEEAGISFALLEEDGASTLVLSDRLEKGTARPGGPLPFVDNPNGSSEKEHVARVRLGHEVRPGALAIRDHDFRNPAFALFGEAPPAPSPEDAYEQYLYEPGGFLVEGDRGGGTPVADDKGAARHEQAFGVERATRMLQGERTGRRSIAFETNAIDLWPGRVFSIEHHPHAELGERERLLVTSFSLSGTPDGDWTMQGSAVFASAPFKPAQRTPKPRVQGVQSAVVVGPPGQEIHTDEFGRVRVQFPWDREGQNDDGSSPWIRVSQGWAGTGYGMIVIPRIGQEVLVGFLDGDPDRPVIVGRVFNATQRVPYKLPENKTRSTWKSDSSMGSDGFNEILFEDLKGQELVYEQAERDRRRLVKHDERITVGHDRRKLVKNDEDDRTLGYVKVFIGKDHDVVVKNDKRERVEGDSHVRVWGKRNQEVDKSESLFVREDRHEVIGQNHALAAGRQIHIAAGTALVIEAANDLTLKGPGGFIRIDSGGVTIRGEVVRINSGGAPGEGRGASPEEPADAFEATTEDISLTLLGQ